MEVEREGEKHQCVVASCMPPTGDLACNPGMCPDWESNQWPIGSQSSAQSTEPQQPGPAFVVFLLGQHKLNETAYKTVKYRGQGLCCLISPLYPQELRNGERGKSPKQKI